MKTVLVTGANGFIAQALIPKLVKSGNYMVYALTSNREKAENNYIEFLGNNSLSIVTLEDPLNDKIHSVVHLAGEPVASSVLTKKRFQVINSRRLTFLHSLKAYLKDADVRYFIQASATDIYTDSEGEVTEQDNIDENEFARICFSQEFNAKELFEGQFTTVAVTRFGIVLGKHSIPVKWMQRIPPMSIVGAHNYLPYVALKDVVKALLFLLDREERGIFNVVSPGYLTFNDILHSINHRTILGIRLPVPTFMFRYSDRRAALLLADKKVKPQHLLSLGFEFGVKDGKTLEEYLN